MDPKTWFDNGVLLGIVIAVGMGLWKISTWLAANVVKPMVGKHLEFLDVLATTLSAQTNILNKMEDNLTSVKEAVDDRKICGYNTLHKPTEMIVSPTQSAGSACPTPSVKTKGDLEL